MSVPIKTKGMDTVSKYSLLTISWVFSFMSVNLTLIPTILSSAASLIVIYKSYLEIKKIRKK